MGISLFVGYNVFIWLQWERGPVGLFSYIAVMYTSIVAPIVNSLSLLYNILIMNAAFYQNLDLGLNLHLHLLSKFSLLLYFQCYRFLLKFKNRMTIFILIYLIIVLL